MSSLVIENTDQLYFVDKVIRAECLRVGYVVDKFCIVMKRCCTSREFGSKDTYDEEYMRWYAQLQKALDLIVNATKENDFSYTRLYRNSEWSMTVEECLEVFLTTLHQLKPDPAEEK